MEQQIYLCGIQPTNQSQLTIGNYLGVILPLVQLQEQNKAIQIYLLIADLHAFTIPYTKIQQNNIKKFIQVLIACGVDPHKTTIILQSTLPEHTQLCYLLMCYTSVGELFRMTQYKDKKQKLLKHHDQKSLVPAGLLFYPCLMAADILLYQTDFVLVGADQKQHIELARDIACRINHHWKANIFTVPKPLIINKTIMDLKNPKLKMSKSSANPDGYISLWDDQQTIFKKIKSATTDSYNEIKYRPQEQPGVTNLITIYSLFSAQTPSITIEQFQKNNINNYLLLKQVVAQIIYQKLRVIQDNITAQNKQPQKIVAIMQNVFAPSSAVKKLVQRNIQPLLAKIGLNYQEL